ncbi:unnamed protein product [Lactuca saligna]|uniref:Uncharacterized protein n=1 Tax=Lactuca saligna TaxID=75948 RepID=A0AA35ZE79_LACSI|nr:unnamed protein product [Lactuca saligna]
MDLGEGGEDNQEKSSTVGSVSGASPDNDCDDSNNEQNKLRENFGSDIGSLDENNVVPFMLLKMRDKIERVDNKVESANVQVGAMNSKLDLIIKSIFGCQVSHLIHSKPRTTTRPLDLVLTQPLNGRI